LKPQSPSAPGLPPPVFDINLPKPKGHQPGARNLVMCLPLVDAAIAKAAAMTPMGAPQTSQPTLTVARRPGHLRKNTTTTTAEAPTTAAAALTLLQEPPTHVMTMRTRALHTGVRDTLASPPATGVSNPL
jgi:hypothetical protein